MTLERRLSLAVVIPLLLGIAGIAAAILALCGGHLIYSLDDSYISLALGDRIAHGHYGINLGEASSPSSSILYPFVLALFGWAPWQDWAPLVINAAAAAATGALIAAEACRLGIVARREQIPAAATLIVALCLAMNVVGLVFVGLEHSLHLLTSVAVVFGLWRALDSGRAPRWLVATIVLLPLWRFEGLALAGLAIAALALAGQWRPAIVAAVGIAAALGAYMAAMAQLGLPLLPSSVLVKSAVARETADAAGIPALLHGIAANLTGALRNPEAYPVFLLLGLIVARPLIWRPRTMQTWLFPAVVAGALAAHILFGAWGWFARYEAYAVAIGAAGAMVLWREAIAGFVASTRLVGVAAAAAAMLFIGQDYVIAEAATPVASLGIYEQHYQMHRFATEFYRLPVGVNDLGLVAYRNPNYVLDLWGLGSETARRARAVAASHPDWLERLVASRQVGLVMIYDQWFAGQIPGSWRRVATLTAAHRITAPFDTVSFYATSPEAAPAALAALRDFAGHVDHGTQLTLFPPTNFVAGDPR